MKRLSPLLFVFLLLGVTMLWTAQKVEANTLKTTVTVSEEAGKPRAYHLDNEHNIVLIYTPDSGGLKVSSYDVSGRSIESGDPKRFLTDVAALAPARGYKFLASAVSPNGKKLGIVYKDDNSANSFVVSVDLTTGTATEVANIGSINIDLTKIFLDDNYHYIVTEGSIFRAENLSYTKTPVTGASRKFRHAITDGTHIFSFGFQTGAGGIFLQKDPIGSGSPSVQAFDSPITTNRIPFGQFASKLPSGYANYFQQPVISICNNNIYLYIGEDDIGARLNIKIYNKNLVLQHQVMRTPGNFDVIQSVACSPSDGKAYIMLLDVSDTNNIVSNLITYSNSLSSPTTIQLPGKSNSIMVPLYLTLAARDGVVTPIRAVDVVASEDTQYLIPIYSQCTDASFGPSCAPCTCSNGKCDWGELGDGKCLNCNADYSGPNCDTLCSCLVPDQQCSTGIEGSGKCDCSHLPAPYSDIYCEHCKPGFWKNGNICNICPTGYYCLNDIRIACENALVTGLDHCPATTPPPPTSEPPTLVPTTPVPTQPITRGDYVPIVVAIILFLIVLLIIFAGLSWKKERLDKKRYWMSAGIKAQSMTQPADPASVNNMLNTAANH